MAWCDWERPPSTVSFPWDVCVSGRTRVSWLMWCHFTLELMTADWWHLICWSVFFYPPQAAGPVSCSKGLHFIQTRGGILSGSGSHCCCAAHAYACWGVATSPKPQKAYKHSFDVYAVAFCVGGLLLKDKTLTLTFVNFYNSDLGQVYF